MDDDANQMDAGTGGSGALSGKKVDWETALSTTTGDVELLLEVLDAFQIEIPQMIRQIHESLVTGDAKSLHLAAHTTKNGLYSIGAQAVGDIAFQIELLGKEGALEGVPPLLKQLDGAMPQVEQEVQLFKRQNGRE